MCVWGGGRVEVHWSTNYLNSWKKTPSNHKGVENKGFHTMVEAITKQEVTRGNMLLRLGGRKNWGNQKQATFALLQGPELEV